MTNPTLDDDRIDAMRRTVLDRIDEDVARRGRRARHVVGLAAASVLVVGLGGYAVDQVGGGTGAGGSSSAADDSGGTALREGTTSSEPAAPGGAPTDLAPSDLAPTDRQVVTTGQVAVTVADARGTAQRLSVWVESIGGRVDSRTEDGAGRDASATLTVRVPSTRVTATIERLRTYGTVEDVSLQNADVTAQATDLDARIDALKISIDRLEGILADAGSSGELIKAEGALTQRQEQLESLQAQRQTVADQVALSTLTIDLSPRAGVETVEPGGFTGGLRDGWNALVSTVNHVVEGVGVALPWAVVVLVVLGAGRLVSRRRTR